MIRARKLIDIWRRGDAPSLRYQGQMILILCLEQQTSVCTAVIPGLAYIKTI